jgi:serine protease
MRALIVLIALASVAHADQIVPGRALVRYRSDTRARLLAFDGADEKTTRAAIEDLAREGDVLWAEPDRIRHTTMTTTGRDPDDPMFQYQWALERLHAPQAWMRSVGADSVVVAVIDTGVRPHPDLDARVLPGWDFVSNPASAGDGDGRDGDPTDPGEPTEASSGLHGTHIAGIIGAESDNGLGVAGLDWRCRLLPVRALGVEHGQGVDSDIADAIRWAAGLHVDGAPDNLTPAGVINLSFGGAGRSATLQAAVNDARARGVVVVAAAGNDAMDARNDSPAGLDGVIAVGALGPDGQRAGYSNFGPTISLMAPGGLPGGSSGVLSTLGDAGYAYYAGTSQAAAFVSAAASLVRSVAPSLAADRVRALLEASADPSAQCASPANPASPGCGAGLVDLDAALALASSCQNGGDCPSPPPSPVVTSGCSAVPGASPPLGLTLLVASAICALLRRKRCRRSDSIGKTSR